jgi:hypothetical protein
MIALFATTKICMTLLHPGIVVGRLQHEQLIPRNRMNDLKVNIAFTKEFRHDE